MKTYLKYILSPTVVLCILIYFFGTLIATGIRVDTIFGIQMTSGEIVTLVSFFLLHLFFLADYLDNRSRDKSRRYYINNHIHHWEYSNGIFLCRRVNCKSVIQYYDNRFIVLRNHRGDIIRRYVK